MLPERRERRLSTVVLKAMAGLAASADLEYLVAPVRPSWKERYPFSLFGHGHLDRALLVPDHHLQEHAVEMCTMCGHQL